MGKLFGTNGVRGVINQDFTTEMVLDISRAAGTVLGPGRFAISTDARMGGEMFKEIAIAGLLSTGCDVVDIGPSPTPCLQFNTPNLNCVGAVMITASHNPPKFNGIKIIGSDGIEVTRETEGSMEDVYFSKSFRLASWDGIGSLSHDDRAIRRYMDSIKTQVHFC